MLAERILAGDIRAASRLMRDIDDEIPSAREELKLLYPHTGRAYLIGITGPPGAGKSTLVDQLIAHYRKRGKRVGVVAIDPTSPFTGGAILGDRIRMNRHADDPGVFIRSLATRGHLGGISGSTVDIVNVLDAMGNDVIIIETVGVGQDEVDIVRESHTTIVVMVPGLGDDIQAIKAGILEIGDLFVVNKADREGAERTARELEVMLELSPPHDDGWTPSVLRTQASRDIGIGELVDACDRHRSHLQTTGGFDRFRERRSKSQFDDLLQRTLFETARTILARDGWYDRILAGVRDRAVDPYTAADQAISRVIPPY